MMMMMMMMIMMMNMMMMMMMIRYCSSHDVMKRDGRGDEEEVEVEVVG